MSEQETQETRYWELMREAHGIYTQMYNLRKRFFHVTHVGLGTWGRQMPLDEQSAARMQELTKQRNRILGQARRIKKAFA